MERVTAKLLNEEKNLDKIGAIKYEGTMVAPAVKNDTIYPLTVTAVGDNKEETTETKDIFVRGSAVFEKEFIAAKSTGEEIDYMRDAYNIDVDIGETNDFEFCVSRGEWSEEKYGYEKRIFIPFTEYGGIIEDIQSSTGAGEIIVRGPCWRGMLERKIVEPPTEQTHLILNGELNSVLKTLIGDRFDGLFIVENKDTGIQVKDWKVDRYVSLYDAITKLLNTYGQRLQISYIEPEGLDYGYVSLEAVPITDYSDMLEYSQDSKVSVTIRDFRGGINHLVCIGQGENEQRTILHLYVQEDGSVGKVPCYTGVKERAAVYEYTSADLEQLEEHGAKRLKELQNYKKCEMKVQDADLELGDIIAGYDDITDTHVKKPVIDKILTVNNGRIEIEYKVKGDD